MVVVCPQSLVIDKTEIDVEKKDEYPLTAFSPYAPYIR